MIRRPRRSPLFPYTPLFRSAASLARTAALSSLAAQRRAHRVVYHSSSLAGQLAAVESGLAVAVFTRCSVPPHLQVLQNLPADRKSTRLNSSHLVISYAVFCL